MNRIYNIDKDSFSSGQIGSKIWLCEKLENLFDKIDIIWIYGGWYGITNFLLRSRNNIEIKQVRSFDIDPECQIVADVINENWVIDQWQFKAFTQDCNQLVPERVDLIINTSTEHFDNRSWFDNIPVGTVVALQGNDMPHDDHCSTTVNLSEFLASYPLSFTYYTGERKFTYPDWQFTRFMVIGKK